MRLFKAASLVLAIPLALTSCSQDEVLNHQQSHEESLGLSTTESDDIILMRQLGFNSISVNEGEYTANVEGGSDILLTIVSEELDVTIFEFTEGTSTTYLKTENDGLNNYLAFGTYTNGQFTPSEVWIDSWNAQIRYEEVFDPNQPDSKLRAAALAPYVASGGNQYDFGGQGEGALDDPAVIGLHERRSQCDPDNFAAKASAYCDPQGFQWVGAMDVGCLWGDFACVCVREFECI